MIKNVVMDMGNVLLDFNPYVILDKVCETKEEKDIIYRELFKGEEWIMGDYGQITNAERYDRVKARVPKDLHSKLKECVEHWDICMTPINGAKEFCDYVLEKGLGLYVLSNACNKFYEYFPKEYDMDMFNGIVVSSDVHMIKPDIKIYEHLLLKYNLNPMECFFVDDRLENVEGARNAGMSALVFDNNYSDVIKELEEYYGR